MTEETPPPPSSPMRWILRVDAATSSSRGTMGVTLALSCLVSTGSPVGYAAAGVLFLAWVCVGIVGKRHDLRRRNKGSSAESE